ncbi:hypothetical protein N0V82_003577 [Gnomoniopsis sp. IMI 355080]|nr:hypothetical protein N0V82_003577 [Gnomoniopsis sp. IMI 355080]
MSTPASVLIVGGGTFGTSTAYYLSQNPTAYKSITVLDPFPIPGPETAGNDLNKVIRADYPDAIYGSLANEAINLWSDPEGMYKGLYHRCGWFYASGGDSLDFITTASDTARKLGLELPQPVTAEEVRSKFPVFKGTMEGWKTVWNSSAGWANAGGALQRMAEAAERNGARYITGDAGNVKQLLFDENGRCVGAKVADGTAHFADLVILAAGANAASIIDFKGQLVAKGHGVGHIQLTPEEAKKYADMPIVTHLEGGLVFPPQEDNIIKIGADHFLTNFASSGVSLPRYRSYNPSDEALGIPAPVEKHLRRFLGEILPELAEREWSDTRICWDADMPDYHFLIGKHPAHDGLHLAVGGSAHGFKFLPVLGKYVVQSIEGSLDNRMAAKWRWRPGASLEGPCPHVTPLIELSEIPGWEPTKS